MKLYLINLHDEDGVRMTSRYAGSMLSARDARNEIVERYDVSKKDVEIDEVSVSTDKASLLELLNELCEFADQKPSEVQSGN